MEWHTLRRRLLSTFAALALMVPAISAQTVREPVDLDAARRIREEGLNRSQLDSLARYLLDVIGPRLTGSTNMRRANDWTAQTFRDWGLANVKVEPWGRFGKGWERVSFSGRVLDPYVQPLNASALAWSGSTRGTVTGPVRILTTSDTADMARYRQQVRGAWIMSDSASMMAPEFEPSPLRTPLDRLLDTTRQQQQQFTPPTPEQQARQRATQAANRRLYDVARAERAAGILQFSSRAYGILRAQGGPYSTQVRFDSITDPLPAIQLSREQFGQIYRNVKRGIPVRLEVNVQNRWVPGDSAANTLAEIPGSDLKDQVVMLGAHLDSWFGSQGATDNAAGSLVMMEAIRIIKTLGLQPRRTIRIALWSGEEQGLLGSRNWVRNHPEELTKISAYVNVDNGTGRLRGIWNQSNAAATPIFQQILSPFQDLGVVVAKHGNTGGTDHLAFDAAGVPGFNFIQDPIEYGTRTHHTDADSYERLVINDLQQAAVVVAYTVYHLAMRDEMMPRKPAPQTSGN